MSRTLSPKGQELLDDLPPYFADDEAARAVIDPLARELQRVEDTANAVRHGSFPQNADDTYHLLGLWEFTLGLPVEPPGASVAERRNNVLARLRARNSVSGQSWVANVTAAIGSPAWTYREGPTPGVLAVDIPYAPASYSAGQIQTLIRDLTPANLQLSVSYSTGFIIGVSRLGEHL